MRYVYRSSCDVPLYLLQLKVLGRMKAQPSFSTASVPFATVVTDLTRCHRTWFHKVRNSKKNPLFCVNESCVSAAASGSMLRRYPASCSTGDEVWVDFNANILPWFAYQACFQFTIQTNARNPPAARDGFSCFYGDAYCGGEGMGKLEETAEALAQMSGPSSACIVV